VTIRIIKILVVLILAANAFWYGFWCAFHYCPPFQIFALVIGGHSPYCTLAQAIRGYQNTLRHEGIKKRLSGEIRLVEEDSAGFALWQTPGGRLWTPKSDETLLPHLLSEQERRLYGAGEHGIRSGDIVLDCGAHVGVYTREALAEGAKLVVAIEPAPDNVECLRRNLATEIAAHRVIVHAKGVWDKDDFLTLQVYPDNSARDSFVIDWKEAHAGAKVPLTTIDNLVSELKLERVDFIKMDIEGAERRAIAGARGTLAKYRPRLAIAAYHLLDDAESIPRAVRSIWSGYRMECGPCGKDNYLIRPEVLYFR